MLLGVIPRLVEWERGKGKVGERVGARGRRTERKERWKGGGKKRGKEKVCSVVYSTGKYHCSSLLSSLSLSPLPPSLPPFHHRSPHTCHTLLTDW